MPKYIALLRGINVSGQKMIKMDKLRSIFELMDFQNVVTYIQSGNVIFDSGEEDPGVVRDRIVPVFIRTLKELQGLSRIHLTRRLKLKRMSKGILPFYLRPRQMQLSLSLNPFKMR